MPLDREALLHSLQGCIQLASTIRDATASFALRFPCMFMPCSALQETRGRSLRGHTKHVAPRHVSLPHYSTCHAGACQVHSVHVLSPACQGAAAAVLIECPMYERRLVALNVSGKPVSNYAFPDGASFEATTATLAIPQPPTQSTDPESSFTTYGFAIAKHAIIYLFCVHVAFVFVVVVVVVVVVDV